MEYHKSSGDPGERKVPWLNQPENSVGDISKSHTDTTASAAAGPKLENRKKPGKVRDLVHASAYPQYCMIKTHHSHLFNLSLLGKKIYKMTSLNPYKSTSM